MGRGKSVDPNSKTDVILTSARYAAEGDHLIMAQGYQRVGFVWSDLLLFDRNQLLGFLRMGKQIATGHSNETPGDFTVLARIVEANGMLAIEGSSGLRDDLGLPLF
ncbi:MAG: hypothetical protein PVI78_02440 [Anaerolineales bacterium]|jgi:hypothetical protein